MVSPWRGLRGCGVRDVVVMAMLLKWWQCGCDLALKLTRCGYGDFGEVVMVMWLCFWRCAFGDDVVVVMIVM